LLENLGKKAKGNARKCTIKDELSGERQTFPVLKKGKKRRIQAMFRKEYSSKSFSFDDRKDKSGNFLEIQ